VKGPLVVGFFPPYSKDEEESDGIVEGLAHVEFALDDISKCLKDKKAVFRLDVTRRITLRDGKSVRRIDIPSDSDRSVGLVLVMPGRPPRIEYATAGPGSLAEIGPAAAAEYFAAPACRTDP